MVESSPTFQSPNGTFRMLRVNGTAAVAGVRVWCESQKGTATFRVYVAPSESGDLRVQSGTDITPASSAPSMVTVSAPGGWVEVYHQSNAATDDTVRAAALVQ